MNWNSSANQKKKRQNKYLTYNFESELNLKQLISTHFFCFLHKGEIENVF